MASACLGMELMSDNFECLEVSVASLILMISADPLLYTLPASDPLLLKNNELKEQPSIMPLQRRRMAFMNKVKYA